MGALLQFTHQLQTECCITCGVEFAMPQDLVVQRRKNHENFFCPNGHPQRYVGETEEQKLKRQVERLEREKKWAEEARDRANKNREHAEHRAAALKGVVTKTKKRIGHGVCPCCTRSFQNLRRHMTAKHPDYAAEEAREP